MLRPTWRLRDLRLVLVGLFFVLAWGGIGYRLFQVQVVEAAEFEAGLKLIRDRTGKDKFVITKEALEDPGRFLSTLVKNAYAEHCPPDAEPRDL